MKKTRILIIGPYPPPLGGVTVECLTLTECLSEFGNRVKVDTFNTNSTIPKLCLQIPNFCIQLLKSDSVFIYGSHRRVCLFSIVFIPLCKLIRKRNVVKITGGNLWEYFQSSSGVLKAILSKSLFRSDSLFLETQYLVEHFQQQFSNVHWFPMTRIRSDHPFKPTSPEEQLPDTDLRQKESPDLNVVFLGYINESKGVPLLIEVGETLEHIGIDAYGEFECLDGKQLNEQAFAGKKVRYKGVIQPSELPEILKNYDVLVLPTHYRGEGYPGVIIEAKRSGLAVVSTRWRSIPEIVDHDINGLLIEPDNPAELANALRRLNTDRDFLDKIKRASYQSFDDFDSRIWCKILIDHLTGEKRKND